MSRSIYLKRIQTNLLNNMKNEPVLKINNLSMVFDDENGGLDALENLNFSVQPQEFICVLGPSGGGKSTLLRIIAGLLKPTSGEIQFTKSDSDGSKPKIGLVFQQANLLPWRNVIDNIKLPLELQGASRDFINSRAEEMISLIGLNGFEESWPHNLSGGMAQRVALARALIQDPDLLLLDEPFGSLDALTREQMGVELLRIWQIRKNTVIMVTHSIAESLLLSDRVLVLSQRPGHICQDIINHLPRPRSEDMRYTQEFGDMAKQIRTYIGEKNGELKTI